MSTELDWDALATAVRERRERQGLRQSDIPLRGGPSLGTVQNIEQASRTTYSSRTKRQLEVALALQDGAVDRILTGTVEEGELTNVWVRADVAVAAASAAAAEVTVDRGRPTAPTQYISPQGIPSEEAFGTPTIIGGAARADLGGLTAPARAERTRGAAHSDLGGLGTDHERTVHDSVGITDTANVRRIYGGDSGVGSESGRVGRLPTLFDMRIELVRTMEFLAVGALGPSSGGVVERAHRLVVEAYQLIADEMVRESHTQVQSLDESLD